MLLSFKKQYYLLPKDLKETTTLNLILHFTSISECHWHSYANAQTVSTTRKLITVQERPRAAQIKPTGHVDHRPQFAHPIYNVVQVSLHSVSQLCWFRIRCNDCRADMHRPRRAVRIDTLITSKTLTAKTYCG